MLEIFVIAEEETRQQLRTSAALQWCRRTYAGWEQGVGYIYVFVKCILNRFDESCMGTEIRLHYFVQEFHTTRFYEHSKNNRSKICQGYLMIRLFS